MDVSHFASQTWTVTIPINSRLSYLLFWSKICWRRLLKAPIYELFKCEFCKGRWLSELKSKHMMTRTSNTWNDLEKPNVGENSWRVSFSSSYNYLAAGIYRCTAYKRPSWTSYRIFLMSKHLYNIATTLRPPITFQCIKDKLTVAD